MKLKLFIIFLFFLTACKSISNDNSKDSAQNSKIKIDTLQKIDSNFYQDTIVINDMKFIQTIKDNKFECLKTVSGDTIIKSENYYFEIKFLDIDKDNFKDIRVFITSNSPNQCDNYLYDKSLKTFKKIENCDNDIKKIKGTIYYSTYNSIGCGDLNWESYLCKIEKLKLIHCGHIIGQGCEFEIEKNPQIIEIYKIDNEKEILIEKLPYLINIPKFDNKWDFIDKYWTKNYRKFEMK